MVNLPCDYRPFWQTGFGGKRCPSGRALARGAIIFPVQFMTTVQEALAMLSKDSASR